MDSCHIFNFLFGTRKATTELSKRFSAAKKARRNGAHTGDKDPVTHQTPASPLKQLQSKLASFATGSSKATTTTVKCEKLTCEPQCGIYRANLVGTADIGCHEDSHQEQANHEIKNFNIEIIENPATKLYGDCGESQYNNPISVSGSTIPSNNYNSSSLSKTVTSSGERQDKPGHIDQVSQDQSDTVEHKIQRQYYKQIDLYQDCVENSHESWSSSRSRTIDCTDSEPSTPRKSDKVKSLVQSFESTSLIQAESPTRTASVTSTPSKRPRWPPGSEVQSNATKTKPTTIVKPLPPKTPPKSNKAKCLNLQLTLNKPTKIDQLFKEEQFLMRFFDNLEPLDRCTAAQVCRSWRDILYSNRIYWKDLVCFIDCTQMRREHLVEYILNTIESAKLGQHKNNQADVSHLHRSTTFLTDMDPREIWRIQALCNRFSRVIKSSTTKTIVNDSCSSDTESTTTTATNTVNCMANNHQDIITSNQQQSTNVCLASKSSSIPSQISSTLSSVSFSSLLSPLSESSRVESIKEKLYNSLDDRGFDAICLFGATDEDIEDLIVKTPTRMHERILVGRLNSCSISDRGFELFASTFNRIEEIELTGCNEISNYIDFEPFDNLRVVNITDCINIGDGIARQLIKVLHQLDELTIHAYHLTDAFLDFIKVDSGDLKLRRLRLPNCKEITEFNGISKIAKAFPYLEELSISGSTKIGDYGIEILSEHAKNLKSLDLSWCTMITDISLERIAYDMSVKLTELILDRNVNITDIGLSYLAARSNLTLLYIRWCPRVTDIGLESILSIKTLKYLSLAGLHQITARSLLSLIECESLEQVELTNCPAVNRDLLHFLEKNMPRCDIIY